MDFRTAFGQIARRLRESNGDTQETIGKESRYTDSMIRKVELGQRAPSEPLCTFLDQKYDAHGILIDLGGFARADASGFPDWIEREQAATDIRTYEIGCIPGLLQTEAYARTLIEARTPWLDIEERVQMRLSRQAVLDRAKVRAVIEQAAIERIIGDPDTQYEQLMRLLSLPSNVTVQIVPTMAGLHPGVDGPMVLLRFDSGRPLARADGRGKGEIFDDPTTVRRMEQDFDAIIAAAMSPEDSAEYIAAVVEELDQ